MDPIQTAELMTETNDFIIAHIFMAFQITLEKIIEKIF